MSAADVLGEGLRPGERVVERASRTRGGRSTRSRAGPGSRARRGGRGPRRSRRRRPGRRRGAGCDPGSPGGAARGRRARAARAGRRPSRRRGRCRRAAAGRGPRPAWRGPSRAEQTVAPAHGSRSAPGARRNQRTVRSHMSGPSRGAGVEHQPGCGFGNAVGQPTGSASVAGSTSTTTSMCSNPSAAARSRRLGRRGGAERQVDDAEREGHGRRLGVRPENSIPEGITMPTVWRCWPSTWSKCSATSSGVQPPSRHMNAICLGCWKIVYA